MVVTTKLRRASILDTFRDLVPRSIRRDGVVLEQHIREGRFQRSLALITAFSSLLSGLEVSYEHYRGSFSQQIMWTPVILSASLTVAAIGAVFSRWTARRVLPLLSVLTLVDGIVGCYFHIRGVARKPGGWRIPVVNVIMGPPVLAPLLFALSGYLGIIASLLRREDDPASALLPESLSPAGSLRSLAPRRTDSGAFTLEQHIREGRFQKNLAVAAGLAALFSGIEAFYSHYKNGFAFRLTQWSPIVLTPLMLIAGFGTIRSRAVGRTLLPLASVLALLDGGLGFFFHARGILRRPGGAKLPLYNLIYGPPIFAPLLFAASGFMGVLASLLRRADT